MATLKLDPLHLINWIERLQNVFGVDLPEEIAQVNGVLIGKSTALYGLIGHLHAVLGGTAARATHPSGSLSRAKEMPTRMLEEIEYSHLLEELQEE